MADELDSTGETGATDAERQRAGRRGSGLSQKLLLLTILFVMIAEVLIYIPSIANFRNTWLQEKLDMAAVIAMTVESPAVTSASSGIETQMLAAVGIEAIAIRRNGQHWLLAAGNMPGAVAAEHDLTAMKPMESVRGAFRTLLSGENRWIRVRGDPPLGSQAFEIVIREAPLRYALLQYSRNILLLSLAISAISACLVFVALRAIIVRPIQRLAANIVAFSASPEDPATLIQPSGRGDEIGEAEERLADMQRALTDTLKQRRRLADLGLAVSKINHDLRNILASAQLFSDRLGATDDPLVKRFGPKIIAAIDRAIGYTRSVLSYGQANEAPPKRRLVAVSRLADDVADVLMLPNHPKVHWENRIPADLACDADPDQLFRVLLNLCRNALDAVDGSGAEDPAVIRAVWIEGKREGTIVRLCVGDTGPGVPARAKAALFQPFQGSARAGGTGLGLPIAAEIARAHGGEIALVERPGSGAVFQITIPDRPVDLQARREARAR